MNYFRPARLSPTGVENPTAVPQQRQSAAEHYCAVMPPQQSRKTHAGGLNVPTASSAAGSSISLINFFLIHLIKWHREIELQIAKNEDKNGNSQKLQIRLFKTLSNLFSIPFRSETDQLQSTGQILFAWKCTVKRIPSPCMHDMTGHNQVNPLLTGAPSILTSGAPTWTSGGEPTSKQLLLSSCSANKPWHAIDIAKTPKHAQSVTW